MSDLFGQITFPVFLYLVFLFFLIASGFAFLVGIGLALKSQRAFRFFSLMNRWVSLRKVTRPLTEPHFVEPALLKHPVWLGTLIVAGAGASLFLLKGTDLRPTLTLLEGTLPGFSIQNIAENLRSFLMVGNALCLVVGSMVLFFPHPLVAIERYTDRWYTGRKALAPLEIPHSEIDAWVMKHPTSTGIALIILSFSVGVLMLSYMEGIGG